MGLGEPTTVPAAIGLGPVIVIFCFSRTSVVGAGGSGDESVMPLTGSHMRRVTPPSACWNVQFAAAGAETRTSHVSTARPAVAVMSHCTVSVPAAEAFETRISRLPSVIVVPSATALTSCGVDDGPVTTIVAAVPVG